MNFVQLILLVVILNFSFCFGVEIVDTLTNTIHYGQNEITLANGEWLKVSGVVDTIFKEKKFRLATVNGPFIITTRSPIPNLTLNNELSLYGPYRRIDSTKNRISAKIVWHADTVLYKEISSNPLPSHFSNSEENAAVHFYRQKKIGGGSLLAITGGGLLIGGIVKLIALNKEPPYVPDSATAAFFGSDGLDFHMGGRSREQSAGIIVFLGGTTMGIGLSQLVLGTRAPEVTLKDNSVTLSLAFEYDRQRKGIFLVGQF